MTAPKNLKKIYERNTVVGPFQCNCKLLVCPQTGHGLLIDPGDEAPRILKALENARTETGLSVDVKYLMHTHAHLDHIGATRYVKEALESEALTQAGRESPRITLHRADEAIYRQLQKQGELFGIQYDEPLPVDQFLEDGHELWVGKMKLSILHTPGHSPGAVCIRLHENSDIGAEETVYSGDTLFQGSVGRTDLWGGNEDELYRSIRRRLLPLDEGTRVCPGHGPETTIGIEARENPFLK